MRIEIEIEIKNAASAEAVYELRNYLQENIEGLDVSIKEQPIPEGQMGLGVEELLMEAIVAGFTHAATAEVLHKKVTPILTKVMAKYGLAKMKPEEGGAHDTEDIGIVTTYKFEGKKAQYFIDSKGKEKVLDAGAYSLDTDRSYAVLIGCSDYQNRFPAIPPAKGNVDDLYNLLSDKRYVGLKRENIFRIVDQSSDEIQEALYNASRKKDIETLIIYYTGHGFRTDTKTYYLAAPNTKKIGDTIIGGIDFDFIKNNILRNSAAKQKILILDACNSGLASQGIDTPSVEVDAKGSFTITSSSADEVSYFGKDQRNTYFTGALVNLLKHGVENEKEMLSLEDLFEHTKAAMNEKGFPAPTFKNELNIAADSFLLAQNPSFSYDKLKTRLERLVAEGKLDEALLEYGNLLKRFPDDVEIHKKTRQLENEIAFTRLVHEGDDLFFGKKAYTAATGKYKKALEIKDDYTTKNKLRQCEEKGDSLAGSLMSKLPGKVWWMSATVAAIVVAVTAPFIMNLNKEKKTAETTNNVASYTNLLVSEMNKPSASINIDSIHAFIMNGAPVNTIDSMGWTALHYAADRNSVDLAKTLIDKGADVNIKDRDGDTPLHAAATKNSVNVAGMLIASKADVNAANKEGKTPLHYAVDSNAINVARLLIEKGAHINATDSGGFTPLDLATKWEMKALLKQFGGKLGD